MVLAVNILAEEGEGETTRRDRNDDDDDDDNDGGGIEHMGSRPSPNKNKGGRSRSFSVVSNQTNLLRKALRSPDLRRTPQRLFGTPLQSRPSITSESMGQFGGVRTDLRGFTGAAGAVGPEAGRLSRGSAPHRHNS